MRHARPSVGPRETIADEYHLTEWISFKERLCVQSAASHNERRYRAAVSVVITGEQITRQTLSFTTRSLGGSVLLLNDIHVKSCVQFDHVSLGANADKNVRRKRAQSPVRQRARPCLWPL